MARHLAWGLRLLAGAWLLASAGCTKDQTPGPEQAQELVAEPALEPVVIAGGTPEFRTLAAQAMRLWQRDIEEYRRLTRDPPALRRQAEEFMRTVQLGMLPQVYGPGHAKTAQMGERLFEQGCRDPLLKSYYGRAVCCAEGAYESMPLCVESLNAWEQSGYPGVYRRMAVFTLFAEAKLYAKSVDWPRLRGEAASLAACRVGDTTIAPEMRRVVFHELQPLLGDECTSHWEDAVAIHEACSKVPQADPWIIHMLAGQAYVSRAWHHRGGGWAYTVTPEGWKLFAENLEKAAEEFAEALKLHPECPEAAAQMIAVAMAGESKQSPQDWFDKVVAAQLDYLPAYGQMRWALRPRWGGSHEELYAFGCRAADTRRYDTMVPFELALALNDIDEELDYDRTFWRREGVYPRVKEVLEGMAKEPSRADGAGACPSRSGVLTIHAAVAERAGQYKEARRLLEELGDRLDRWLLETWSRHSESYLAAIYAFTGKDAADVEKAWRTLYEAPKPYTAEVLEQARSLFQQALAADDNERSRAYCRARVAEMEGRLAFGAGRWFEKKFDPTLLSWLMTDGSWSRESENSAVGHSGRSASRVHVRPCFVPLPPLEIEFDIEAPDGAAFPLTLGLFIPAGNRARGEKQTYHQFFVRTRDNLAGIEIAGNSKTVPCPLNPSNHIRVQLAEGRAVLSVNGQVCLDRSNADFHPEAAFDFGCHDRLPPQMKVRVSNVRMHKWEPPKEEAASSITRTPSGARLER